MTRTWDTFLFSGELDLLEARLTELYEHVDRFVIVEARLTFQGDPKPLWFGEYWSRFDPWTDKIVYVVADLDLAAGCKDREHAQRDAAWQGMDGWEPGDVILHGDADEIPRPCDWQAAAGTKLLCRYHPVAVNLRDPAQAWFGGYVPYAGTARLAMTDIRGGYHSLSHPDVLDAGWHFSWLGGPDAMRAKARAFSHPELIQAADRAADSWQAGPVNPGTGSRLNLVPVDGTFPRYMQERRGPAAWYWPGEG